MTKNAQQKQQLGEGKRYPEVYVIYNDKIQKGRRRSSRKRERGSGDTVGESKDSTQDLWRTLSTRKDIGSTREGGEASR